MEHGAWLSSTLLPGSDEDSGEACQDEVLSCGCYEEVYVIGFYPTRSGRLRRWDLPLPCLSDTPLACMSPYLLDFVHDGFVVRADEL